MSVIREVEQKSEAPVRPIEARSGWPASRELELFRRKVSIVFAFIIGLGLLFLIRKVLILLFIAAVLAAGIAPVVHRVRVLFRRYFKRRLRRGTAVLVVYFPFLFAAVLLLIFVAPRLLSEGMELASDLPELVESKIIVPLERYVPMNAVRAMLADSRGPDGANRAVVLGYLRGGATILACIIAVLFLIVYMLMDAERLRNLFLLLFPAEERGRMRGMVIRMSKRMSGWLSGQLLLAGIIGGVTFVVLLSLRIPYALPLAILAAFGELIPVIGPIVGATPAVIIALFQSPWQFWSVLIMAIMIQKLENLFLVPRIMGKKVSVSPLALIIAFMIGGSILGVIGGIMAIPAAAIIQVIFEEGFVFSRERRLNRERSGSLLKSNDV